MAAHREVAETAKPPEVFSAVVEILSGAQGVSPATLDQLAALTRNMALDGARREDPMREIFARLGDKWSMLLLLVLRTGAFRHAMLKRLVNALAADDEISQRVFTLRLRSLERDGLVARAITPTVPPQVSYTLTELGRELLAQIDVLMAWIRRSNSTIRAAQAAFDAADD